MNVRKANLPFWCFAVGARIVTMIAVVPRTSYHTGALFIYLRISKVMVMLAPGLVRALGTDGMYCTLREKNGGEDLDRLKQW